MRDGETTQTANSAALYVIRYTQSFDAAVEAGRFFQARFLRWYYSAFGAGLLVGALIAVKSLPVGLGIVVSCGLMILTTRYAVMDRMFGRRRLRSVLDRAIELTLGDEGISWDGPTGTSHFPWTSITEVRANARTVLFVRDRILLAFAPVSSFASPEEMAGAIAYSRRQIANAESGGATARSA